MDIPCPEDCVYLSGGQAGAWDGRQTENRRDLLRIAPYIQSLTQAQERWFFVTLAGLAGLRTTRRGLDDRLLAQAVTAFRKTVETRARGLLYQHPPEDPRAEGLVRDIEGLFRADAAQAAQEPAAALADSDLLPVLAALEASLAHAVSDGPTAFLDTADRLVHRFGQKLPAPARPPSLIVEP